MVLILFSLLSSCRTKFSNKVFYANYGCAHIFEFSRDGFGSLKVGEYDLDLNEKGTNLNNIKFEKSFKMKDSNLRRLNEIIDTIENQKLILTDRTRKGAWYFGLTIENKTKVRIYGEMTDSYNEILRILLESSKGRSSFDCSDY